MRGPGSFAPLPLLLFLVLGQAAPADAQAPPPPPPATLGRVELFGGLTFVTPSADSAWTSAYGPQLKYGTVNASSAGQALEISAERANGLELGGAFFFHEAFGVQVLFGMDRPDLSGTSGPYATRIDYITRQPPDYAPRQVVIDNIRAWPGVGGELKQRHLSFNLVARGRLGRVAVAEVSGGLSYFRVEGVFSPVGYTVYHLGGHSVLFPEEYEIELALDPTSGFGFNLGGTLDLNLGGPVAFTADARYFGSGDLTAPTRVARVLNLDEVVLLDEIDSIQDGLRPPALELTPARFRVLAGLKVRF